MSKVELYEQIRLAARDEGLGIRALSRRFRVHRRDVRAALESPVPAERKRAERDSPVFGEWHDWIREILTADLDAPKKQRHTAKRIRDRLAREKQVVVSESQCRLVVARLRADVIARASDGRVTQKVFVPQTRLPGDEAETDWGEFQAVIGGQQVKLHLFTMWLAFSTRGFHRAYLNEAQESFTDAHVRAFERFDGVPKLVRYDNLKTAVQKVLRGRTRIENQHFIALRSHYGFESFFCEPGIDGAHEKGGVEGDIGRYRRNYLTPVPAFDTLAELNDYLARCDIEDDDRWVFGRQRGAGATSGGLAQVEAGALWPLPIERFTAVTRFTARVDTKSRVCVRQSFYSVPARLVGLRVTVLLGADTVSFMHNNQVVAAHVRAIHRKSEVLELDHYLEVLWRRPGALSSSTPLVQARATGRFRPEHQQLWDLARRRHGDAVGTRILCEVLMLHRTHPADHVIAGIRAALTIDTLDPDVIAVETRRAIEHHTTPPEPLPIIERPPDLTVYDQLLRKDQP